MAKQRNIGLGIAIVLAILAAIVLVVLPVIINIVQGDPLLTGVAINLIYAVFVVGAFVAIFAAVPLITSVIASKKRANKMDGFDSWNKD